MIPSYPALVFVVTLLSMESQAGSPKSSMRSQRTTSGNLPSTSRPTSTVSMDPSSDALIKLTETEWSKTTTYQAQFKQVVLSKRMHTTDETTGTLSVRKPGNLRWESNDGTTQILNGKRVILVKTNRRRKNRSIDIYENGIAQVDLGALTFLRQDGSLLNNYRALKLKETATFVEYRLSPRSRESDSYIAEIDKSGYFLSALTMETNEARVRIEFSERKSNPQLDEALFVYVPQPGDVVHKQ